MFIRIYQILRSLFVLSIVFLCAEASFCSPNSLNKQNSATSFNLHKGHDNYWRVSGDESSQILTPQTYRTVHFVKGMFIPPGNFVICLKCQNFFSGNEKKDQTRFQKLLLFPFHVFW